MGTNFEENSTYIFETFLSRRFNNENRHSNFNETNETEFLYITKETEYR